MTFFSVTEIICNDNVKQILTHKAPLFPVRQHMAAQMHFTQQLCSILNFNIYFSSEILKSAANVSFNQQSIYRIILAAFSS